MTTDVQQNQNDDEFTAAFAQFGTDETPADETPADTATTDETPPADEASGDETPPADEPPADETPPVDEPPADEKPQSTSDADLLARLAELVKQPPAAKPADETPPAAAEPDLYTADEQTFLSEYEKDWPDVAKAEQLRRRAEYRDLVNHVFNEVAKELGPLAQTVKTLAERTHLSDLREAVDDYDDVRDKVVDWVNNQPSYLQNAYKHVIQQGTPDEISDLVARYKKEVASDTPPVTPRKAESELPTTTKQAVAALAPVSSKRSAVVVADDPNDFEGAFAAAAKML